MFLSTQKVPTAVDPVANILVATLDHLTKFGVFGPAEQRIYLPVVVVVVVVVKL